MKTKHFFLAIIFLFLIQSNIFAQWMQQTNGLTESWSVGLSIDAYDSLNAVLSTRWNNSEPAKIYITKDGGDSWENTTPFISQDREVEDISMVDSLHIWGAVSNGSILATSDGGKNWDIQFYDTTLTTYMNYIEMFDLKNGIAMGDGLTPEQHPAVFLKTTDGGNTWVSINDSSFGGFTADNWRGLDFVNLDTGFFCESGIGVQSLFITSNGGARWKYANYEGNLQILKFYNKDIGLVKEGGDTMQRTLDGGNNWELIKLDYGGWGNDIEFLPNDPSKVWYVDGYGRHALYSNDTGSTWTEQTMPTTDFVGRDIVFTDDKHGWILCDNGQLFYTNNNGGIITEVEKEKPNVLPTEFRLKQNYPNPFNPSTTISYSIPVETFREASMQNVTLKVFDLLGKEVATLVNEKQSAGSYKVEFNSTVDRKGFSSGVYFYRLQTGSFVKTKKMVLLR